MTTEQIHVFHHEDPDFEDVPFIVRKGGEKWFKIAYREVGEGKPFAGECPHVFRSEAEALDPKNLEDDLGFTVKFWREQLNDRHNAVVAGGLHYRIGKEGEPFPGFGGSKWQFRNLATGEVVTSHNVWFQGEIPLFAREMFPDTHEVV